MDELLAQEHACIEQKAKEIAELRERLAKLKQLNGEVQRRRAASAHKRREARVESLLAELMPLPTALPDASAPEPQQMLEALSVPGSSTMPATPSSGSAAQLLTPSSSRVAKRPPVSKAKASPAPSPGQRKPAQQQKPAPPKLAPAAAALASQMVDSPYNRPSRMLAAAAAASAVVKR